MAAGLTTVVLLLHILTASALESTSEQVLPQRRPHLTGCVSANMETFRCRWNVGTFHNLSEPGDLHLFYINKKPSLASPKEWSECPHYSADPPNECFFNENHTSIWTYYSVQLRSRDQSVLYDENLFHVQDIVQPDPPVGLNWTLLNVSLTSTYYDIMLSWKPPQSADVEMGWMTLQYEVHYRDVNSDLWDAVDLVKSTHRSLYGLQTNVNHEVRVRCKMLGGKEFGEFSDSVFVHIPSKVSRFPVVALLIFGALCLVAILMLVIISQQEKLMVILLPPVPGPKIKGIDPELLKKGKLRELTSILGGPPDLRPELYNNDPWVEFIDLDIEEQNDRLTELDTDCLMERSLSSNCTPVSIGFRDDDSGRASCCDPDLPIDPDVSPFHPLIPNQTLSKEPLCLAASEPTSPVQSPTAAEPPFAALGREALYTQVSEVRSSGKVLLSPEEQTEGGKTTGKDSEKDIMVEKEKEKREFQLLVVNADQGGYTSEFNAGKMSPRLPTGDASEPCQTGENLSSSPSPSPYYESDTTTMSLLPPAPVYTMVEGVDRQNSLLLTQNSTPARQLIIPKAMLTPDGYLTPDILGSVTP
ncbi:growth hormone receptor-like isoform X2 [Xiphias gladius]|nr:growth hormone receptor-like isoform X2 [Xiphias gladius]XP_040012906.1 growth hormone receptor-like isoform X2 [Xiphias gladius]XP_040012907.1 growth hormone receptor-like isoform X2 [Xiphias gladius]XP_040012908.1 growth hormone receptor-like isoform X2 [Xiphias gladius]